MNDEKPQAPVEIPMQALSADALAGMIESFILREGTDYGSVEISHDTKTKQVTKQLEKGDIKIVFDPNTDSATLMTTRAWKLLNR
jgi:uncharacterized protein YheU (UPF0270 family)